MRILRYVTLALSVWAAGAVCAAEPAPGRHALLVGCTKYDNLAEALYLEGPGNDTLLMRDLLSNRYGFPKENIRILAEHAGKDRRPTRLNIEREFKRLADVVRSGDQVVVLLAGHGSVQPQQADAAFPAPDGCDRIFLPCDIGKWDGGSGHVANAIRGVEIGAWLRPIVAKKAALWVIVDACHSGSGIRSGDNEKKRQIDPETQGGLEIPRSILDRAALQAAQKHGEKADGAAVPALPLPSQEGVAILYACQSSETTVEKPLPATAADRKYHGLLTFTLTELLRRADEPLTYLELAQRIQSQYSGLGRQAPTPYVEGTDRNRQVLGAREYPRRSRIRLVKAGDGLKVSAGAVHGLTSGSILAVYPPAGQKGDRPLGHVCIGEVGTTSAKAEPCKFKDQPGNDSLPDQGRCELVAIPMGT